MENASKALIIAGAILLSILIIAIGMYIYTSAQAQVTNSITNMSTSEIEAYNSNFTQYSGKQTGSQVKALIGRLIANAKTYEDEPAKIPSASIQGAAADKADPAARPEAENDITAYVTALNAASDHVKLKHTYWVKTEMGASGLIENVIVEYNLPNAGDAGDAGGGT